MHFSVTAHIPYISKREISESTNKNRVNVTDYLLVNSFGYLDFEIDAYTVQTGVIATSSGNAEALLLHYYKAFKQEIRREQVISFKDTGTATLDDIPRKPTWEEIIPLKSKLPVQYYLYACFGAIINEVYTGEYSYELGTFQITGVKQLKSNEICIVNSLGIEMIVDGSIKIEYYSTSCIYEVKFSTDFGGSISPSTEIRYRIRYVDQDNAVIGECKSSLGVVNKVSKKKRKNIKELIDEFKAQQ